MATPEETTAQQVLDAATPPQAPAQPVPPQENWEARFKGTSTIINRLNTQIADLQAQHAQALADTEQLRAQLALKDTEKTVAVSQRDTQLQQLVEAKTKLESENRTLLALKQKIDIAKEIGRPDLIEVADAIPSIEDPTVLKEIMSGMAKWSDGLVQKREKELLAGVTPSMGGVPPVPTSPLPPIEDEVAWRRYVNDTSDPIEKQRRFNEWSKVGLNSK